MTGTAPYNGQIPTDPIQTTAALVACTVLVNTLTPEEASNLAALLPIALSVLPIARR